MKTENKKLTKSEMRVAVAKDVIKQIRLKVYTPIHGTYISAEFESQIGEGIDDLQEAMKTPFKRCDVCAKGAMILSAARLFDRVSLTDGNGVWLSWDNRRLGGLDEKILTDIFGARNANLMEHAFEKWIPANLSKSQQAATAFGKRHRSPRSRLIAIMKNVIANNGVFNP